MNLLQTLKELESKATKGPWLYDERVGCVAIYNGEKENCLNLPQNRFVANKNGHWVKDVPGQADHWEVYEPDINNFKFIVESRNAMPALLNALEIALNYFDEISRHSKDDCTDLSHSAYTAQEALTEINKLLGVSNDKA